MSNAVHECFECIESCSYVVVHVKRCSCALLGDHEVLKEREENAGGYQLEVNLNEIGLV